MEARGGIEPPNKGFADLCLTTWLPRLIGDASLFVKPYVTSSETKNPAGGGATGQNLERETGFEPATSTLARSHSTTELLPLDLFDYSKFLHPVKPAALGQRHV